MRKKNPTPQESTSFFKIGLAEGWNLMINNNRKHWVGGKHDVYPKRNKKVCPAYMVNLLCRLALQI